MANFNKVILMGNLTRDPQLSYLPSQTPVVDFGLAVNRNWTGQDGQRREDTCFVDCRAFGKQAEVINHYMNKGKPILVEGRLQFQQWQAQDGSKRSKHIVVVEGFQFVGAPGAQGGSPAYGEESQAPPRQSRRPAPSQPARPPKDEPQAPYGDQDDANRPPSEDDIPF